MPAMKEKINYLELLSNRLISNFGYILVFEFMPDKKDLTDSNVWMNYLRENIDNYLSPEEKKDLILQQIKVIHNEEMNEMIFIITYELVAAEMVFILQKLFKNQEFVKGNPFDPNQKPYDFFFYRFCQEGLGMEHDLSIKMD